MADIRQVKGCCKLGLGLISNRLSFDNGWV